MVRTHYDGQGRIERLALGGRYYGESDLVRVGAYRTIAGHPMATRFEHGNGRIEEWSAALAALEQEARFPNRGSTDPYRPVGKQTEGLASFAAYETPDIDVFDIDRFDQAQPGFDAAGLPNIYTGTNGDWALDWNASGQLVHMKRSVGDEIFFVHDAQGRRVAKQVVTTGETSGQIKTTYFAYDGIQMIGETAAVDSKNIEAQGVIVHRTVYLGYRPVARIDLPGNTGWRAKLSGPEIRAIHTSVSGQVLQMTDARQKVLWQETEHLPGGITRMRDRFGRGLSLAQATTAWNALTEQERNNFINDTGLGQEEFVDMLGYKTFGGAFTENEGKNAFMAAAVFRLKDGTGDTVLKDWLLDLFKGQANFNFISRLFLQRNLNQIFDYPKNNIMINHLSNNEPAGTQAWAKRQIQIEEELAARIGAYHNSGNGKYLNNTSFNPTGYVAEYVDEFLGTLGRGDWRSLRCADDLTNPYGLQEEKNDELYGLQMEELRF